MILSFKNGCRIGQKTDAMRGIQNIKKRVEDSIVVKNRIDLYPLAEVSSPVTPFLLRVLVLVFLYACPECN